MRPKERRETGEQDLFRSRLDQIIDLTACAGEAGASDRLALPGRAVRRGLHGRAAVIRRCRRG